MVCTVSGLHYHVVHIYLDISMPHVMEQSCSSSMISGSCILQPKWHSPLVVSTLLSNERSILYILWSHHNLIIPRKSIHERQHQMSCSAVNQHINVWEVKIILRASFVQITKVYSNSNLAILFGNRDDISQPLRILNH